MANCPINNGIIKSIVIPTPHKMNRRGGGTNADTVQIVADTAKPIEYLFVNGLVEGTRYQTRIYSITRRNLIAA
jgi:hypothetical protein